MRANDRFARRRGGFTLIELMVAVAIIGILAATAITSFSFMQLRTRRSEASSNLSAIRSYQLAYFHENGSYVNAPPSPAAFPLGPKQPWYTVQNSFSSVPGQGFDILAFAPEGATFFDYDTNSPLGFLGFTASAYGDVDSDGAVSTFMYVHPDPTGVQVPSILAGGLTGPWDLATCQPLLNTVAQVHWQPGCGFPVADDY
jgi:prepilin-type N-terminal cleavage/methylation domain-containing protein